MQPREESVRGCVATVQFSRAVREGVRVAGLWDVPASCAGLSKLNSMRRARARRNAELARSGLVDVPGRSGVAFHVEPATTKVAGARGAFPIGFLLELPRKEVIQPQLPLRLPCYDFVPVTSPTLGRCPHNPCGLRLAHGLQVLPAPMT